MPEHNRAVERTLASALSDQHACWSRGQRRPVEDYFEEHPELGSNPEHAVDLIYNEYLLREELGEEPCREEYLQRFPAYAVELQRQFELTSALGPDRSGDSGDAALTVADSVESYRGHRPHSVSRGEPRADRQPDVCEEGSGSPSPEKADSALHVRCPYCMSDCTVAEHDDLGQIPCQTCGKTFSLVLEQTLPYKGRAKRIGRFELIDCLGRGGFGTVWLAQAVGHSDLFASRRIVTVSRIAVFKATRTGVAHVIPVIVLLVPFAVFMNRRRRVGSDIDFYPLLNFTHAGCFM